MRLTLVLDETAAPQPTYWALSGCVDSVEAREQLRNRESTPKPDRIHMIDEYGDFHGHKGIQPVAAAIREWITGNDGVDAAIWTGLGPKWPGEQRKRFGEWSTGAAIAYLSSLANERIHHDAELYFRHAPPDVYTKLRRLVEKELGWNRVALPCELLENS